MAIKGKVNLMPMIGTLSEMKIGTSGYVSAGDILFTQRALFLAKNTEVYQEDEEEITENEDDEIYIPITRIGTEMTDKDFELDFSKHEATGFCMENDLWYPKLMHNKDAYIIFHNYPTTEEPVATPKTLSQQLSEALDKEDYATAAKIKQQIHAQK